ncbi:hypothetical protein N9850_13925 [Granulosicoccus sp.]|nr:hypothetical protein [Granulosicoccus sp.]MDB4224861.1 hypothetical protein [Granulosicoccus sp.]
MKALDPILAVVKSSWHTLLFAGLLFAAATQLLQLILLMIRFGDVPNYAIHYDWVSSIHLIAESTPSIRDMVFIMFEEWWIEIGFMNYDYGNGISEWSLNIIPSRLFILTLMGGMIATLVKLKQQTFCSTPIQNAAMASASMGTVLMCMTSAAMSWVVCCATPSWVVGLAMLGLGVSTSLALEDLGPTLFYTGLGLLGVSILIVANKQAEPVQERRVLIENKDSKMKQSYLSPTINRTG